MRTASKGDRQSFLSFLKAGKLRLPYCTGCERFVYPPGRRLPGCRHGAQEWRPISGRGQVYAATVARHRPQDGGDRSIVVVELAEGPRMLTTIVGLAPDRVRIGASVSAIIESGESGDVTPRIVFRIAEESRP